MIRANVLAEFAAPVRARRASTHGAFLPSYGLAEATLAVTFAPLGEGVRVDVVGRGRTLEVERRAVPADGKAGARPGAQLRPVRPADARLRGRDPRRAEPAAARAAIGRVCINGPSLMSGYFRNDLATHGVLLENGWLDTGDLGYLVDGQLVITGRSKDLIIVGGRNIWPQDLEWAVEHLDGVRPGDVAAFAVTGDDDSEQVVAVVQCRATTTGGAGPAARRGGRRRPARRRRRVRGRAGADALADLHHLGQAQPRRGQGRLSERRHPRHRGRRPSSRASSRGSPSPADGRAARRAIADGHDGRAHRRHRLRRPPCRRGAGRRRLSGPRARTPRRSRPARPGRRRWSRARWTTRSSLPFLVRARRRSSMSPAPFVRATRRLFHAVNAEATARLAAAAAAPGCRLILRSPRSRRASPRSRPMPRARQRARRAALRLRRRHARHR